MTSTEDTWQPAEPGTPAREDISITPTENIP